MYKEIVRLNKAGGMEGEGGNIHEDRGKRRGGQSDGSIN